MNGLKLELSLIIDQIVKGNLEKGNSIGINGHIYKEAFELQ